MMSLHHGRSVERIYCGLAWIVTMVMNTTIYDSFYQGLGILQMEKIVSTAPVLYSLIESLQTISGHDSFQLQLN